jgi:hypothetical protein
MTEPQSDSAPNRFTIWKQALQQPAFAIEVVATIAAVTCGLTIFTDYLHFIETRPGAALADPLLDCFRPIKLTVPTFVVLYASLIIAITYVSRYPKHMLVSFQAYVLLLGLRALSMYLLPLDPPVATIPLKDPIVELFGDASKPFTRDLFFSGHTSLMFLFYLTAVPRWLKTSFLVGTVFVGSFVMLQHVHYAVDVLVAPFMAYASVRIMQTVHARIGGYAPPK